METNALPRYDDSVNTTGCCPKFNPAGWDDQDMHFRDKKFIHATTRSAMHVPLNSGSVFARMQSHLDKQNVAKAKGEVAKDVYFFYTTCPNCAKAYGKNYVVGAAEV